MSWWAHRTRVRPMNHRLADMLDHLFAFDITAHLLGHDFVQQALVAAALLGLVAGLIGPFIVMRQMSFAVHGSSELSLTGAAFALLVGFEVGVGRADRQRAGSGPVRHPGPARPRARFGDRRGAGVRIGPGGAVHPPLPGPDRHQFRVADRPDRRRRLLGAGHAGAGLPARHRRAARRATGRCCSPPSIPRSPRPAACRCGRWASCSPRWSVWLRRRPCRSSGRCW